MQIEHHDGKLIITIDVSEAALAAATPSSTGKTLIVDQTSGFRRYGPVSLNCTVTVRNPKYEARPAAAS